MYRILSLIIGYAFGCVQWAYIAGKIKGVDIREHGSGNAGMTNVTRVLGGRAGLLVFIGDMAKAAAAYAVVNLIFGEAAAAAYPLLPGLYAGFGAILGHNFPFYMGFRGGKGVSCTLAVVAMASWPSLLVICAVGIPLLVWKRYISLVSLVGSAMAPVMFIVFHAPWEAVGVGLLMALLIWWRHRGNLKRLINGTESKFLSKKAS